MATNIGRVEFIVGADGGVLEPELRRIGRRAGLAGGQATGRAFNQALTRETRTGIRDLGRDIGGYVRTLTTTSPAMQRVNQQLTVMRDRARAAGVAFRNGLTAPLRVTRDALTSFFNTARERSGFNGMLEGVRSIRFSLDDLEQTFPRTSIAVRNFGNRLSELRERMRYFAPDADKMDAASRRLNLSFARLGRTLAARFSFGRLRSELSESVRSSDALTSANRRLSRSFDNLGESAGNNSRLLKSHVARTIAAWTGLVLAIGEGTATLGSGVGASLTALIASLATAIGGLGGLAGAAVGGFAVQVALAVSALQKMKEAVPGVQSAVDRLSESWGNAGTQVAQVWGPAVIRFLDTITGFLSNTALVDAMAQSLSGITDAFTNALNGPGFQQFLDALTNIIPGALTNLGSGLANLVSGLASIFAAASPALAVFADQFNQWAGEWATRMAEMAADGRLQEFFNNALNSINAILGVVGSLGNALGTVFAAGNETGISMLNTLTGLFDRWNEWMNTIEGQKALETWFENGERIFNGLLDLAGDLGSALGQLVTPESVERLISFMDSLGEFLPIASGILEVFGRLDILNLFTQALNLIGTALEPILPVLGEIADIISANLSTAMEKLTPLFERLGEILAPVLEKFSVLLAAILPPLIDVIIAVLDVLLSLVDMFTSVDQAVGQNEDALKIWGDVLTNIFTVVGGILTTFLSISSGVFSTVAALLRGDFTGAFKAAQDMVRGVFDAIGINFDDFVSGLAGMVRDAQNFFGDIGRAIEGFGKTVADIFGGVIGWIQDAVGWFGSLFSSANNASGAVRNAGNASSGSRSRIPMATGGVLNGPTRILAGEAGPEAIVPLRRNLSQVDPAVRWLSAMAQGKSPAMASGGVVGSGKTLNVHPGAIVVEETIDGEHTAVSVLRSVVEYVAG